MKSEQEQEQGDSHRNRGRSILQSLFWMRAASWNWKCVWLYMRMYVLNTEPHIYAKRDIEPRELGARERKRKKLDRKKKINSNNNTKLDFLCTHQSIREPVRYCVRCSVRFIHDMAEVVCVTWLNWERIHIGNWHTFGTSLFIYRHMDVFCVTPIHAQNVHCKFRLIDLGE